MHLRPALVLAALLPAACTVNPNAGSSESEHREADDGSVRTTIVRDAVARDGCRVTVDYVRVMEPTDAATRINDRLRGSAQDRDYALSCPEPLQEVERQFIVENRHGILSVVRVNRTQLELDPPDEIQFYWVNVFDTVFGDRLAVEHWLSPGGMRTLVDLCIATYADQNAALGHAPVPDDQLETACHHAIYGADAAGGRIRDSVAVTPGGAQIYLRSSAEWAERLPAVTVPWSQFSEYVFHSSVVDIASDDGPVNAPPRVEFLAHSEAP